MVFGWLDYHLYDFRVGERRFEAPDPEATDEDSSRVTLRELGLEPGARFTYRYDFGDDWEHEVVVEDVYLTMREPDEDPLPVLVGGARAGPLEDSGGPFGYMRMVEALADPRHPEHHEFRSWAGDRFDGELFDERMAANNLTLAAGWGAV